MDTYTAAQRGTIATGGARYVDGTETLRLTVFNAAASVGVAIAGRLLVDDGRVVPFQHRLVPTTDRAASTFDVTLPAGWLLGVQARLTSGAPLVAQTYAVLSLGTGTSSTFTELDLLAAGAITAAKRLAFPGSSIVGPLDGVGALRSITGTDPAAGVEIAETVPTGARWRLRGFAAVLATDATVANREPHLLIDDGAITLFEGGASGNLAASLSQRFTMVNTYQATLGSGVRTINGPHHDILLAAGFRIRTNTSAIVAGDNWAAPQLLVEEWIEGA